MILTHRYPMSFGWGAMKILLDTHTFIWLNSESKRLSQPVLTLCQDRSNQLLLSVASIWELQIKLQLGKLRLQSSLKQTIENQQSINNIEILPITFQHVLELDNLPFHHKDPFDRLLVAQAKWENAALATRDPSIARYPVQAIW